MSLYRTWRPKSFADLVGQDAVVRTLRTALESGKLAHAYLFSGPRGSGKTSAAKIMARCINCVHGPTPEPDNTCENCREMLAGTAMDVMELDAASNRGIEEIRAIRESVKFAPSSMRMKVFIIDEAHMLTREGANAFLKTLEEPPAHAVFILATTAPESLPPTILSRCQRYAFRRIPVSTMIERMRTIAQAEGIAIDADALGAIAYRADGGLRDALTMLEQVAAFAGGPVDAASVDAAFGTTGLGYARRLVAAVLANDAASALHAVDEASDAGSDMLGLIRATIAEYRNLLVARVDASLLSRDLAEGDAAATVALATGTPQPKVVRGLRLLADALAAARFSGNPRLELETAVLRLAVATDDPSLDALATRVALLEAGASAGAPATPRTVVTAPSPAAAPPRPAAVTPPRPAAAPPRTATTTVTVAPESPPAAVESSPPVVAKPAVVAAGPPVLSSDPVVAHETPAVDSAPPAAASEPVAPRAAGEPPTLLRVRSQWASIRARAQDERASLRAPLSRATVDGFENGVLTIGLVDQSMESFVRAHLKIIENAASAALDVPVRVVVRVGGATRTGTAPSEGAAKPPAEPAVTEGDQDDGLLAYARRKIAAGNPTGAQSR